MRVLRAIGVEIAVFIVSLILGNILYRVIADSLPNAGMDRSPDAAQGAGIALAVLVVVVRLIIRAVRRKRPS